MKRSRQLALLLVSSLLGVHHALVTVAYAATQTARTCSQQDVQAAIDAAHDGDTVVVPAGTSEYKTIAQGVPALKIDNKGITLAGAGIGQTILRDNTYETGKHQWSDGLINAQGGKGKTLRITGFTFDGSGIKDAGKPAIIYINGSYADLRIDHCQFLNVNGAIKTIGLMRGVVDHCRYELMEDHALGNPYFYWMEGTSAAAWKTPTQLGSADAIYIEDCHVEFHNPKSNDSPALPTMDGARAVFRHNTVFDGFLEFFGVDSRPRGTVSFEVYDNTFTGKCFCAIGLKGGTGVVFNNTVQGKFDRKPIWVTEYRTGGPKQKYGQCDGTSSADGNAPLNADAPTYTGTHSGSDGAAILTCAGRNWTPSALVGYAVWNVTDSSVGKITANTANTITVALKGGKTNNWKAGDAFKVTNGYPAIDQVGRALDADANTVQPQTLEPVYAWNNQYNGSPCKLDVRRFYPREEEYLREGRDFFNAPKPGYTPLQYPHPVVSAETAGTTPPSDLSSDAAPKKPE
jgi:hypothetical protein